MKTLRIYIDEAGTPSIKKPIPEEKFFVLSGILIDSRKYPELRNLVNDFKQKFFRDAKVILHWSDIRRKRGVFKKLFSVSFRKKFMSGLEDTYLKIPFCTINAVINQEKLLKKYPHPWHPYYFGLRIIMERAFLHAKDNGFSKAEIITEGLDPTSDSLLRIEHQRITSMGSLHRTSQEFQSLGFGLTIERKKKNINGLQIADITASVIRSTWLKREKGKKESFAFSFVRKKLRTGKSGHSKGFGIIEVP